MNRIAGASAAVSLMMALSQAPVLADDAVEARLADMDVRLTDADPYHFVLVYRGPIMPFRGDICYHFAGYNETCLDPGLDWLTPATEIELYAPGGVPRDLLQGYMIRVRFPALSGRTYRYPPPRVRE